jgi:hypothetical protein
MDLFTNCFKGRLAVPNHALNGVYDSAELGAQIGSTEAYRNDWLSLAVRTPKLFPDEIAPGRTVRYYNYQKSGGIQRRAEGLIPVGAERDVVAVAKDSNPTSM